MLEAMGTMPQATSRMLTAPRVALGVRGTLRDARMMLEATGRMRKATRGMLTDARDAAGCRETLRDAQRMLGAMGRVPASRGEGGAAGAEPRGPSRRRYKPAGLGSGAAVAGVPGAGHSPARSLPCTMARGQLSGGTWGALVLLGLMLPAAPAGAWYKHVASPRYHTVGRASGLLMGVRRSPYLWRRELAAEPPRHPGTPAGDSPPSPGRPAGENPAAAAPAPPPPPGPGLLLQRLLRRGWGWGRPRPAPARPPPGPQQPQVTRPDGRDWGIGGIGGIRDAPGMPSMWSPAVTLGVLGGSPGHGECGALQGFHQEIGVQGASEGCQRVAGAALYL